MLQALCNKYIWVLKSAFLQAVGLAKTAPKLDGLLEPKFVNAAN